jgi:hypothetical protein
MASRDDPAVTPDNLSIEPDDRAIGSSGHLKLTLGQADGSVR